MRTLLLIASTPLLAATLPAQHIILMTAGTTSAQTIGLDPPHSDLISNHEIYEGQPGPGFYTARPFMPVSLQWVYVGDTDNDGLYVDASTDGPGLDIDAILVKAGTVAPVSPRQVFFSIAAAS